ncbi:hypothetical protein DUNSADRAFT_14545 [Dunaliella salina]|uniref:Uncharacterized protein n=1 Tax=Dunaliella salina TaxID=3046 RepID=A0ABQ7G7A4_DUNSA|nr:hypothetical protein DUNSADRAFT_14545 [Dunaliella salina]|eukprot:KAF5830464.1 hypothetical protein DUNSADRAFT_14545 [Dunaliella salina]
MVAHPASAASPGSAANTTLAPYHTFPGNNSTALEILQAPQQISAFVIVTLGRQRPASASPGVLLPVKPLNAAAGIVEQARGALLFPIRLETADFSRFHSSGPVAGYLCVHLSLPDDQCFDLLLGALGLGFVLSLASAIPIFTVCQLFQCSHRDERQKVAA